MKIHPLQTGTVRVRRSQPIGSRGSGLVRLVNTLRDPEWTDPLPIFAWVVEHPEGLIVIDTGDTARTAEPGYFPGWQPYYRYGVRMAVKPEDEINVKMQAINLDPGEVRWLILTHLHTDHAGGLSHFPKAEILLTPQEWEAAQGFQGRLLGYLNQHYPDWLRPTLVDYADGAYENFLKSKVLTQAGDLRLVPTPGHSPGHQSVVLEAGHAPIVFAGDVSYTLELLLSGAVDGVTQDIPAYQESSRRMREFVTQQKALYLPSHDPGSAARLGGF